MKHEDILKSLCPVQLAGVFDGDLAVEGALLDTALEQSKAILREMFPDTMSDTLPDWERLLELTPLEDATTDQRRQAVIARLRQVGGLSPAYFIAVAASVGQQITIKEYGLRPQCGIARCGNKLATDLTKHMWKVSGLTQPGSFFRAGMSVAGERLSLPSASIEQIFRDLKPAHTLVFFEYAA